MADLEAVLARVEDEISEDARAPLEAKIAETTDVETLITNTDILEAMKVGDGTGEGEALRFPQRGV